MNTYVPFESTMFVNHTDWLFSFAWGFAIFVVMLMSAGLLGVNTYHFLMARNGEEHRLVTQELKKIMHVYVVALFFVILFEFINPYLFATPIVF